MYPETLDEAHRDLERAVTRLERGLVLIYQDVGYESPAYVAANEALAALRSMDRDAVTETIVYGAGGLALAAFEARERGEDYKALPNDAVIRCARHGQDAVADLNGAGKSIQVLGE